MQCFVRDEERGEKNLLNILCEQICGMFGEIVQESRSPTYRSIYLILYQTYSQRK